MAKKMTLSEYVKHWNELSEDFPKFARRFLLKEAIMVRNEAIKTTPKDSGALQSSWRLGNEKTSTVKDEETGKFSAVQEKESDLRAVKKTGHTYSIKISNSMNYASFLEYGTKIGIKPFYMVTKPINEYHRTLYKRFKAEWDAYRKEKGLD